MIKVAFDTGGTFTDFALLDEEGGVHVHKVLSTPDDPARAVLQGVDELLDRLGRRRDGGGLQVFGATTLVTNAVLERKGARVAFLTSRGHRDIPRIRTEGRYDVYDLRQQYPEPLVPRDRCFGVSERLAIDGTVLVPLAEDEVCELVGRVGAADVESAAVCFLHAYAYSAHERRVGELLARGAPRVAVSLSSVVCPEVREYDRASTTIVNAYTQPLMKQHVRQLRRELRARGLRGPVFLMTSSGGVVPAETAAALPVRLIESGPAAGALAAADYGALSAERDVLSFDMGGTTAKMCLIRDGCPVVSTELEVARHERFKRGSGFPLKVQSLQMIEIGAGGGSTASMDRLGLLRVGPRSAGARPGPACYDAGGLEPTVTDADLLLGYLDAATFLGGTFPLRQDAAAAAVARLASQLGVSQTRCAWGIHDLVNENMSKAAVVHAVESGTDPRRCTLVAFGGAGPVHAFGLARKLGIGKIICPLGAGVASALGVLAAPVAVDLAASFPVRLSRWNALSIRQLLARLARQGQHALARAGLSPHAITYHFTVDMRHVGQGREISVALPDPRQLDDQLPQVLHDAFTASYTGLYGRVVPGAEVEAITWRLRVSGPTDHGAGRTVRVDASRAAPTANKGRRPVFFDQLGGFVETPVYDHYALPPGSELTGPAIVEQWESTAVVGPSATAIIDAQRNLVMRLGGATSR